MFISQSSPHLVNRTNCFINNAQPNNIQKKINSRIFKNLEEGFVNRNESLNFSPRSVPKAQFENLPQPIKKQAETTSRLTSFFQFVHQKFQSLIAKIVHCVKQVFSWMKSLFHDSKASKPQPNQARRNIPLQHMREPNGLPIVVVSKEELNNALNKMKAAANGRPKEDRIEVLKKENSNFSKKIEEQEEIIDPLKEASAVVVAPPIKGRVVPLSNPIKSVNFLRPLPPMPSPTPISIQQHLSPLPLPEKDEYIKLPRPLTERDECVDLPPLLPEREEYVELPLPPLPERDECVDLPPLLPEREEYVELPLPPLPERGEYQDTHLFFEAYDDRSFPELPREFLEEDSEINHKEDLPLETTDDFQLLTNTLASIRSGVYDEDDEELEEYEEEDVQENLSPAVDRQKESQQDAEIQNEKTPPSSPQRNNLLNEISRFDKDKLKKVNETEKNRGNTPLEKQLMNSMFEQFLQMNN